MSDENKKEDSTVSFRVFLPDSLRTEFKVWCAREGTNMSEKSRELIEEWVKSKTSKGGK
ncbi:MAG: copy number control protein [Methylacidiphilales bacterium]|nr:copy number control protein [Candidatus Methylacidiphilales bacterium]